MGRTCSIEYSRGNVYEILPVMDDDSQRAQWKK